MTSSLSGSAQTESSVLALTIPSAFFSAIDTNGAEGPTGLSDSVRHDLLRISRGFAVILLVMCAHSQHNYAVILFLTEIAHSYVCSRIYLHVPPGRDDESMPQPVISPEAQRAAQKLADRTPEVNPWACITFLVTTVALMGVTAEFVRLSVSFTRSWHPHPSASD